MDSELEFLKTNFAFTQRLNFIDVSRFMSFDNDMNIKLQANFNFHIFLVTVSVERCCEGNCSRSHIMTYLFYFYNRFWNEIHKMYENNGLHR